MAVPVYMRAVERARWAEAKSTLVVLRAAQIRFGLDAGRYSNDDTLPFEELDVEFTPPQYFIFYVRNSADLLAQAIRKPGGPLSYLGAIWVSINRAGEFSWDPAVPEWLK